MANFHLYILVVEFVLGVSAFAALFHSSFGVAEKTYFALVFLLLAFMIKVYSLQSDTKAENFFEGLFASLLAIEKRIEGQDTKVVDAVESKINELEAKYLSQGHVFGQVLPLSGRFGVWIIGGWLVEKFLLPHL